MTKKFMKMVLKKLVWMPTADIFQNQAVCAFPPTKEKLAGMLYDELLKLQTPDED